MKQSARNGGEVPGNLRVHTTFGGVRDTTFGRAHVRSTVRDTTFGRAHVRSIVRDTTFGRAHVRSAGQGGWSTLFGRLRGQMPGMLLLPLGMFCSWGCDTATLRAAFPEASSLAHIAQKKEAAPPKIPPSVDYYNRVQAPDATLVKTTKPPQTCRDIPHLSSLSFTGPLERSPGAKITREMCQGTAKNWHFFAMTPGPGAFSLGFRSESHLEVALGVGPCNSKPLYCSKGPAIEVGAWPPDTTFWVAVAADPRGDDKKKKSKGGKDSSASKATGEAVDSTASSSAPALPLDQRPYLRLWVDQKRLLQSGESCEPAPVDPCAKGLRCVAEAEIAHCRVRSGESCANSAKWRLLGSPASFSLPVTTLKWSDDLPNICREAATQDRVIALDWRAAYESSPKFGQAGLQLEISLHRAPGWSFSMWAGPCLSPKAPNSTDSTDSTASTGSGKSGESPGTSKTSSLAATVQCAEPGSAATQKAEGAGVARLRWPARAKEGASQPGSRDLREAALWGVQPYLVLEAPPEQISSAEARVFVRIVDGNSPQPLSSADP